MIIQRIQTLYLAIVALLMGTTFLFPSVKGVISTESYNNVYEIMPFGVWGTAADSVGQETLFSTTIMGVMIVLSISLTIFIISKFRDLMTQIRLTVFLIVLLLAIEGFMAYYGYKLVSNLDAISQLQNSFSMTVVASFPLVGALLSYLAMRSMIKDMLLMKSLNSNSMR